MLANLAKIRADLRCWHVRWRIQLPASTCTWMSSPRVMTGHFLSTPTPWLGHSHLRDRDLWCLSAKMVQTTLSSNSTVGRVFQSGELPLRRPERANWEVRGCGFQPGHSQRGDGISTVLLRPIISTTSSLAVGYQDKDAIYNSMFFSLSSYAAHHHMGFFAKGGRTRFSTQVPAPDLVSPTAAI